MTDLLTTDAHLSLPVKREMINPHLLTATYKKWPDPRFAGGKLYFSVLTGPVVVRARKIWKRATEAEGYSVRLRERWIRLYDAAIVAMAEESIPEEV